MYNTCNASNKQTLEIFAMIELRAKVKEWAILNMKI